MEKSNKKPITKVDQKAWLALGDVQKGQMFGRLAPHEVEMERFVLGSMMMMPQLINKIRVNLTPEMFYDNRHETICNAIMELHEQGTHADIIQVTALLRKQNKLDDIGGPFNIVTLSNGVGDPERANDFVPILRELWWRRHLIAQGVGITDAAYGGEEMINISRKLSNLHRTTLEMINGNKPENYANKFDEALFHSDKVARGEIAPYVTTSFPKFDRMIGGYSPGDMICVAARASMGKTAFVTSSMRRYSQQGIKSGLISAEMGSKDIVYRLLAIETGIAFRRIKEGNLDPQQRQRVTDAMMNVRHNIFINDSVPINTERLRGIAMEMVEKYGVKILFIDYLQLIESTLHHQSREQEVSHLSRTIKLMAKELDIPVVALSQLSRAPEKRGTGKEQDFKPVLSDLRDSGSIEQDSDKVIFLFRPDYYKMFRDEVGNDLTGKVLLMVAKNRNGALGVEVMDYIAELMQFKEKDEEVEF